MAIVAPSILSSNFAFLAEESKKVLGYGAKWLHIDVMDGHFVPNITIGPVVIQSLRKEIDAVFDVHLMIENPEQYVEAFAKSGADIITVHVEASEDIKSLIEQIKSYHKKVGISIKPGTDVYDIKELLPLIDLVLVMSVEPGFGGQSFLPNALPKIKELALLKKHHKYTYNIEVDGGINLETGALCTQKGAEVLVAGNYIFKSEDMEGAIKGLIDL